MLKNKTLTTGINLLNVEYNICSYERYIIITSNIDKLAEEDKVLVCIPEDL